MKESSFLPEFEQMLSIGIALVTVFTCGGGFPRGAFCIIFVYYSFISFAFILSALNAKPRWRVIARISIILAFYAIVIGLAAYRFNYKVKGGF